MFRVGVQVEPFLALVVAILGVVLVRLLWLCLILADSCGVVVFQCRCRLSVVLRRLVPLCLATPFAFANWLVGLVVVVLVLGELRATAVAAIVVVDVVGLMLKTLISIPRWGWIVGRVSVG